MKVGYIGSVWRAQDMEQFDWGSDKHSFTLKYDQEHPQLFSPAIITIGNHTISTSHAMWDTGATIVAISGKTASRLDAEPDEIGDGISATGREKSEIYHGTVELPGGIVFHDVEIWGLDLSDLDIDVIIGMDIISRGRLVVEARDGIPTFSFSTDA